MPVYVKDKSIGTTPVSFTANIDTEWQYFANQDKRTSRGLLSSILLLSACFARIIASS